MEVKMKEIPLTQGKIALVDDADYEWLNQRKWHAANNHGWGWYAERKGACDSNGKRHTILMHRVITGAGLGQQVDHKDRDGLNNQRANLRLCTASQNHANQKRCAGCSSRFKGVTWNKREGKWRARIGVHGERIFLGRFDDEVLAALAYNKAATEHFGEFARPNVIAA